MAIALKEIVVVGAGGLGRVAADVLICDPRNGIDYTVLGFVDDDASKTGTEVAGRRVLGALSQLDDLRQAGGDFAVAVAIDEDARRRAVFDDLDSRGFAFANAVDRNAAVADTVELGRGVLIGPGVVIGPYAQVGDGGVLETGCTIDHDVVVGAHARVSVGADVSGGARIGIGATIGAGAVVLHGRTIGDGARVAAGTVVAKNVPGEWGGN